MHRFNNSLFVHRIFCGHQMHHHVYLQNKPTININIGAEYITAIQAVPRQHYVTIPLLDEIVFKRTINK